MQNNSINTRGSQPLAEINGRPGIAWGNVIVPASGRSKIKIKVLGDMLQTNIDLAYGLEKKEIITPIVDVKSVEISEGRLWWLLGLGFTTLFVYFIGVIFIILFFVIKQRWIVVYTSSINLVLFYSKNTGTIEQFRHTVLSINRQLKTPTISRTNNTAPPPPNGTRTASNGASVS